MFKRILAALLLVLGGLVVAPSAASAALPFPMGIAGGGDQPWVTTRASDYARLKQAGATSLRYDIPWEYLQPDSATQAFNWGLFDPVNTDARNAGLDQVAILHMIPRWANGNRCAGANPLTYLGQVYDANGASQFDVLSWHPYNTNPATSPNINSVPDSLNNLTVQRTGAIRKIWATEYGAPTAGAASVSESRQAQLVGEATTAWARKSYAGPLFWYSARDLGPLSSPEREDHFGLLRADSTAKPALSEYARVAGGTRTAFVPI